MHLIRFVRLFGALALIVGLLAGSGASQAAGSSSLTSGFRAFAGAKAREFRVPADTRVVWTATYPDGITQTRYQQYVGAAQVYGGQVTTLRNRAGEQVAVIGSYYPGLKASNTVKLRGAEARGVAERFVGKAGRWAVTLQIDPVDGRQFYQIDTQRFDSRWILHIDAATGKKLKQYNALAHAGTGTGVKGDTKSLDTTGSGSPYALTSVDKRQTTYDAKQAQTDRKLPGTLFTDADNVWNTPGRTSPGQPAAVDAHYYANVTDDFYNDVFGRNSLDDNGLQMKSSVHYGNGYDNAFWNGQQMVYGDGSNTVGGFRELSGGLDVVAHELTHGVTDYTSNLVYQNESGALNEAFSDMMGDTAEFYAAAKNLDPSVGPDWHIGEDVYVTGAGFGQDGFRNMADPREDGDPDHYSERYTGTSDNGGVHTNSGIPNHAYYLLVNGGQNAGCDKTGSDGHTHTADCGVNVPGIGLAKAEQIFYKGFTSLPSNATMGNARAATETAAEALYTNGSAEKTSTSNAWQSVGVAASAPAPSCNVDNATIPFESAHPYSNNMNCTWTYNAGNPNFKFHFSLLDVEKNYDYVDIIDGNGKVLASLTGTYRTGYTIPLVTTNVVKVRLRTDASVTRQGFRVASIKQ
ncbi:MAG: M4 family metallopeptidase [Chloroflexota bacterium]|nr:M4 family metallopeptidase [Chloroflexota bacterium]